jgi:prefoldin subunit 5
LAYSLNVTVVPHAKLGYLSLWPTGQPQPYVSTLNSIDGRVVANAAIVPAGASGAVSVYVTDQTEVIIDVNGYFSAAGSSTLTFVPTTPCRVVDTRQANGAFGGPILAANSNRSFPLSSGACSIPASAAAYSLNATVVPTSTLSYLTLYPTGTTQPTVSTLNSSNGQIVANAAIVPAGTGSAITAYVTNQTQLILDINGYFTASPPAPLVFNTVTPCRIVDTRNSNGTFGGPIMTANSTRSFPIPTGSCGIPSTATAYAFNVTAVPASTLSYLSIWPDGEIQPTVSTLNSSDGQVVANAALVPAGNAGAVDVFVTNQTQVIIDIVGYFNAP